MFTPQPHYCRFYGRLVLSFVSVGFLGWFRVNSYGLSPGYSYDAVRVARDQGNVTASGSTSFSTLYFRSVPLASELTLSWYSKAPP